MAISITDQRSSFLLLIYFITLSSAAFQFQLGSSRSSLNFQNQTKASPLAPTTGNAGTTVIFHLSGNVYKTGYFTAPLSIGQPPMNFDLDIDTGSNLTWVRCDKTSGGKAVNQHYYKPENYVRCDHPLCKPYLQGRPCPRPDDRCRYHVNYADKNRSSGFLVEDNFTLHFTNGKTIVTPRLVFGCDTTEPKSAGMIGLMDSEISILSQLRKAGITIKNVVGHCLNSKGGGFMFLGDVPAIPSSSNIAWVPRSPGSLKEFYSPEPADLFYDGKPTAISKKLQLIYDCGTTYLEVSQSLYRTVLNQIQEDLKGKLETIKSPGEEKYKPFKICWRRPGKPFKSFNDVKMYFKPMLLRFSNNKQFQIPPEAYLMIAEHGDVCFGFFIKKSGTGKGQTVGDISMQDMMMIFDNEKKQIGWVSADCNSIHKS